jgi:hypothetical protein
VTSLLVLLLFLSVATLASRRGAFDELLARAATPLLVGLGAAVSPAGLGFFPPSLLEDLRPALAVGVLWLAALVGLRTSAALRRSSGALLAAAVSIADAALCIAATAAVLLGAAAVGRPIVEIDDALPVAMLVGAGLACLPANGGGFRSAHAGIAEIIALAGAAAYLIVWRGPTLAAAAVAVGLLGAVVARLLAKQISLAPAVAMLSATTLVAGLATLAALPGALAGLVAGLTSGRLRGTAALMPWLLGTARPVLGVVTILLAASAQMSAAALVTGIILGLSSESLLVLSNLLRTDEKPLLERLSMTVGMSMTPMLLVASFALTGSAGATALLPVVLVATATADTAAFAVSLTARARRAAGRPS